MYTSSPNVVVTSSSNVIDTVVEVDVAEVEVDVAVLVEDVDVPVLLLWAVDEPPTT